jgi:hypothetical protein
LSQISDGLVNLCEFVNGAEGVSDIEGKAATGSGERAGKQASFKFTRHAEAFGEDGCFDSCGLFGIASGV